MYLLRYLELAACGTSNYLSHPNIVEKVFLLCTIFAMDVLGVDLVSPISMTLSYVGADKFTNALRQLFILEAVFVG